MDAAWLIVGLGNPGARYERTRHNAGFWFVQALCRRLGCTLKAESKLRGASARVRSGGVDGVILKPDTFMNESGQSVRAAADYFRIGFDRIVVAYDDLDLPPGTVRLKQGGGHGGHNGLRSIFSHLGDQAFWRVRLGIGHPGMREAVTPWVLSRAPATEEQAIIEAVERAIDVLPELLSGRSEAAMQTLHTAS